MLDSGVLLFLRQIKLTREQRTKNCSFDGAMWCLEKKILSYLNLATLFSALFTHLAYIRQERGKISADEKADFFDN